MKPATKFAVVLVTAPNLKIARALARAALQARLIACANLIPKIESHYWWRGKIESGAEVLLVLKTQKSKLAALEKLVLAKHPYDTPEFIVLPLSAGNKKYLDWLRQAAGEGRAHIWTNGCGTTPAVPPANRHGRIKRNVSFGGASVLASRKPNEEYPDFGSPVVSPHQSL
jgi:periplasmic divalent cation tolerance protein